MMNTAEQFEPYRRLLFSIAYRMLGSAMAAEDMVQEASLRFQGIPAESIHSPKALLSTIITRLCINNLQSARAQRETYIGPWLPEPLRTGEDVLASSTDQTELDESISMAFLVLMETLTPTERAVFLLREVFEYGYGEISGRRKWRAGSCSAEPRNISRRTGHVSRPAASSTGGCSTSLSMRCRTARWAGS